MASEKKKSQLIERRRKRRARRIRARVQGSTRRPRLSVFRSQQYMYAQLIDDDISRTLMSSFGKLKEAKQVGKDLAHRAQKQKIRKVVFDRGSYAYHGHVKELAEGAREEGLEF